MEVFFYSHSNDEWFTRSRLDRQIECLEEDLPVLHYGAVLHEWTWGLTHRRLKRTKFNESRFDFCGRLWIPSDRYPSSDSVNQGTIKSRFTTFLLRVKSGETETLGHVVWEIGSDMGGWKTARFPISEPLSQLTLPWYESDWEEIQQEMGRGMWFDVTMPQYPTFSPAILVSLHEIEEIGIELWQFHFFFVVDIFEINSSICPTLCMNNQRNYRVANQVDLFQFPLWETRHLPVRCDSRSRQRVKSGSRRVIGVEILERKSS
jgi:hypothetical protein